MNQRSCARGLRRGAIVRLAVVVLTMVVAVGETPTSSPGWADQIGRPAPVSAQCGVVMADSGVVNNCFSETESGGGLGGQTGIDTGPGEVIIVTGSLDGGMSFPGGEPSPSAAGAGSGGGGDGGGGGGPGTWMSAWLGRDWPSRRVVEWWWLRVPQMFPEQFFWPSGVPLPLPA
jgi:hypothetical protein